MRKMTVRAGAMGLALLIGTLTASPSFAIIDREAVTTYYQDAARSKNLLMLSAGEIDPVTEKFKLPAGFDAPARRSASGRHYMIVQFANQPTPADLDRWEADGYEFLAPIPNNAYAVRSSNKNAAGAASRANVRWTSDFLPGFKVDPFVMDEAALRTKRNDDMDVLVSVWQGESRDVAIKELRLLGAEILQVPKSSGAQRLLVRMSPGLLAKAASLGEVEWIEPRPQVTRRNNSCTGVVQSGEDGNRSIWAHGLHGEGQVIGHIDGSIDIGSCYFRDETNNTPGPSHRKIVAYRGSMGGNGHGTHTAGTAAGLNVSGSTDNAGHAYMAKLSHTADNILLGIGDTPTNLADLFTAAQNDGAFVHTNSYGDDNITNYTYFCVDIDTFTWENENGMVAFASTNASNVLYTPENSKNVLAVGNANRAPNFNNETIGGSCSGPTADGRRKPEIYAPGTSTISAYPGTCNVLAMTGTSMASPAITGEAALARQYYTEGFYPRGVATPSLQFVPSGALLKATILNGAVDMTGITGYPSDTEGWGRLVLDNALYFEGDTRRTWLHDARRSANEGVTQGGQHEFQIEVTNGAEPLRVTLVWMDPPVARNASTVPVNNLDLEVVAPDASVFKGNVFTGGQSATDGSADTINNVEMFLRNTPATGTYTIRVKGTTVNAMSSNQGYAVVASGGMSAPIDAQLSLDSPLYSCASNPQIGLFDGNTTDTQLTVTLTTGEGESEVVTLFKTTNYTYSTSIVVSQSAPTPSNGIIEINGETQITVTYVDANPAPGQSSQLQAFADYDCSVPEVTSVAFPSIVDTAAVIRFTTSEPSQGVVNVMMSCGGKVDPFAYTTIGTNTYQAELVNLLPGINYFVNIEVTDAAGNSGIDDDGGSCYTFKTLASTSSAFFDFEPGEQGFITQVDQGTNADWARLDDGAVAHSPTHVFFGPDLGETTDTSLISPSVAIPTTDPYLSFWHTYEFESGGWDGGVLEISTNDGATWTDLGTDIVIGGYNGAVPSQYQNPLPGGADSREAWINGTKGDMSRVLVDLSGYAGQNVKFRWRVGADVSFGDDGWYIDDVDIIEMGEAPPLPVGFIVW
ncbi:S8 family serine peptidase [bacterium]|nr:S8 family serine peptidase [bacterium]